MLSEPTLHQTKCGTKIRLATNPSHNELALDDGIDVIFIHYDEVDDLIVWMTYFKQWREEQNDEAGT